jgi:acyl carrier protein
MDSPSRTLVHASIASQLRIDEASVADAQRFEELGLDPLGLVQVVIRLESLDPGDGDFPVAMLEHARTVGDLVELVDLWSQPTMRVFPVVSSAPSAFAGR